MGREASDASAGAATNRPPKVFECSRLLLLLLLLLLVLRDCDDEDDDIDLAVDLTAPTLTGVTPMFDGGRFKGTDDDDDDDDDVNTGGGGGVGEGAAKEALLLDALMIVCAMEGGTSKGEEDVAPA